MNNNTSLSIFTFQDVPVRTLIINDEIWFVVADACKVLDIENTHQATNRLNQDGVCTTRVIDSLGREQTAKICNEPNLYRLVFESRKPNAKDFQDWVYKDVLPSIRKTGSYDVQPSKQLTQTKELEQLRKEVREIKRLLTAPEQQPVSRKELKMRVLEAVKELQEDYPEGIHTTDIREASTWFSPRNHTTDQIWHIAEKLVEEGLLQKVQMEKQVGPHHFTVGWYYRMPNEAA